MIVTRDAMPVGVPPMAAYEHLLHLSELPRFGSGVMSLAALDERSAHLVLDLGGRRIEFVAEVAEAEPGRFVRRRARGTAALVESFWLEPLGDGRTNVVAVVELDEAQIALSDAPTVLHNRLLEDLKGFRRFCEEFAAT
ncbi:hypothetical protein [Dactylosporangium sp. CA-092794]|uniref:hypothetical protein n=1 Tax=Dactylosporangium sp. CA-092794 TaxID=3239929 RepID=UPI003D92F22A